MIKIGALRNIWDKFIAIYTQQTLAKSGIETQIMYFQTLEEIENALLSGIVDVRGVPLTTTPSFLRKGLVLAALSDRTDVGMTLTFRKSDNKNNILGIAKNAKIGVHTPIQAEQLKRFGFEIEIILLEDSPDNIINHLLNGDIDGCIAPQRGLSLLHFEDIQFAYHTFRPSEFIPDVGQGAGAIICAEDNFNVRKLVKQYHNISVAEVCNVERTLLKMYQQQCPNTHLAAYCERDKLGYYRLYATDSDGNTLKLSSTTTFGLAAAAFAKMKPKICT